jgi:very-short-patch-repair endonuclease
MREKIFNKYNKKGRLYNIEMLINCNKFNGFTYSNSFYNHKLNCLINHNLKIVITRSSDIGSCPDNDYHFIKYKNPNQLIDNKFTDKVNEIIKRNTWILNRANELNNNLPQSEKWFDNKFKHTKYYKEMNFKRNQLFKSLYICDLISLKYKTIIEVDGSYHDLPIQKLKDEIKDRNYINSNFSIIRVKSNDDNSFNECLNKLEQIISNGVSFNKFQKLKKYYSDEDRVKIQPKIKVNKNDFKTKINMIDFSKKLPF